MIQVASVHVSLFHGSDLLSMEGWSEHGSLWFPNFIISLSHETSAHETLAKLTSQALVGGIVLRIVFRH